MYIPDIVITNVNHPPKWRLTRIKTYKETIKQHIKEI